MTSAKSTIDHTIVRQLAELLNETDLSEIEVEQGPLRIRVARNPGEAVVTHIPSPAQAQAPAPVPVSPPATTQDTAAAEPKPNAAQNPGVLRSPMVGTAYLSPEPGRPAFVLVGDKVSEGQTIVIIEAMKTMNNIPAHNSGTITQICIENEQPVEYGQPLIVIE